MLLKTEDINKLKVSVILVTYGREKELCYVLRQLLEQTRPADEVIVVDKTREHSPETKGFLEALTKENKIILMVQKEGGINRARNMGIKQARGDVIIMIDDDILFTKDLIQAHLNNYIAENIDVVTGQVLCREFPNSSYEPRPSFLNESLVFQLELCLFTLVTALEQRLGAFAEAIVLSERRLRWSCKGLMRIQLFTKRQSFLGGYIEEAI